MGFDRHAIRPRLAALAGLGIHVGTSSWKYPGWRGQLYEEDRYVWRGRFANTRFERGCLEEYATVFRTVCVDAAYYTFPTEKYLEGLAAQVGPGFLFGLKVTDAITVRKFPLLDRFGDRAGKANENYLDAALFAESFLRPCEKIRERIGILMFEFSRFHTPDYAHGRDFVRDLDTFLGRLPGGWPYGIEIRNKQFLHPEYFDCLRRHGVAHVYNSWEAMPSVGEQMAMDGSRTHPELCAARFLLKPGRRYEDAVKAFQPYDRTREVNAAAREEGGKLIYQAKLPPSKGRTFIYVNNRLEGNALETIAAMLDAAGA